MDYEILENKINYKQNGIILATIDFPLIGDNLYDINHTFVDESLRGQGIARKLVELAIKEINKKKGKYIASCSYANKLITKEK